MPGLSKWIYIRFNKYKFSIFLKITKAKSITRAIVPRIKTRLHRNFLITLLPTLLSFEVFYSFQKYLSVEGVYFNLKSGDVFEFAGSWQIFLLSFIAFSIAFVYLFAWYLFFRFRLLKIKHAIFVIFIEIIVIGIASLSVLLKNHNYISGVDVLGIYTVRVGLSYYKSHTFGVDYYHIFMIFHNIFTIISAVAAVTCVGNFAIAITFLPRRIAPLSMEAIIRARLYRINFYNSILFWSIGVVQLVAWVRLPMASIEPSQKTAYMKYMTSLVIYNTGAYTFVLIIASFISALRYRKFANRHAAVPLMEDKNAPDVFDKKMVIYFAAPMLAGLTANIISNLLN